MARLVFGTIGPRRGPAGTNTMGPGLARPVVRAGMGLNFKPTGQAQHGTQKNGLSPIISLKPGSSFSPSFFLFFNQTTFHLKFSNFNQLNLTFNQPN